MKQGFENPPETPKPKMQPQLADIHQDVTTVHHFLLALALVAPRKGWLVGLDGGTKPTAPEVALEVATFSVRFNAKQFTREWRFFAKTANMSIFAISERTPTHFVKIMARFFRPLQGGSNTRTSGRRRQCCCLDP